MNSTFVYQKILFYLLSSSEFYVNQWPFSLYAKTGLTPNVIDMRTAYLNLIYMLICFIFVAVIKHNQL